MVNEFEERPLVSVIIPTYNAEKYVEEALLSIISQTYKNLEIIVIDDASSDNTKKLVSAIAKSDRRVVVYRNRINLGIGGTRSRGIKLAKGAYICWQDADDVSYPNRIALQVDFLNKNTDVGIVGGFLQFINESGESLQMRMYKETDKELRKKIFRYNPVAQPAAMFRREVYEMVGGYNESYIVSEDLEMQLRAGVKYKFGNVQEKVVKYRQINTSLTRKNLKKMELATLQLRRQYSVSSAYEFSFMDKVYNFAQKMSMYMPTGMRMSIFRVLRGDK